jgi:CBS domain-containing protein
VNELRHASEPPLPEATPRNPTAPLPLNRLSRLTAHELMTPGVVVIDEDASLRQGFRALVTHRKHAILVVGPQGQPRGWITDRGLLAHLDGSSDLRPVGDAISEPAVSVPPGATARAALQRLSEEKTTHLLVAPAAGHTPQGVVSAFDLVRAIGT